MKPKFILLFCIAVPLLCMAQQSVASLQVEYDYDAAGNRILRKVITLAPPSPAPPAPAPPKDSLQANKWTSGQVMSEELNPNYALAKNLLFCVEISNA